MAVEPIHLAAAAEARRRIPHMIRVLLAARDKKAAELAEALGLSEGSMSERLRGKTRIPSDELAAIASFLEVPVTTLYDPPEWVTEPDRRIGTEDRRQKVTALKRGQRERRVAKVERRSTNEQVARSFRWIRASAGAEPTAA